MRRSIWKPLIAIIVLLATITAFIHFFATHPEARQQLSQLSPLVIAILLALYAGFLVSLVLILKATLSLCRTSLPTTETLLLTIYSSIINFFGPLQSGPGFRGLYLKKRYGTKLKNYTLATLMYYGFFALWSGLCLLSGLIGGYGVFGLSLLGFVGLGILLWAPSPWRERLQQFPLRAIAGLALASLLQVVLVVVIYAVELKTVSPGVTTQQAIIYTGAANFALFVSLTPGAIGFRESFLLFSQQLHHIDSASIVSASLIDRGMYVLFLGLLGVLALSLHAKDRLKKFAATPVEADS